MARRPIGDSRSQAEAAFKICEILDGHHKCAFETGAKRFGGLRGGKQQTLRNTARVDVLVSHTSLAGNAIGYLRARIKHATATSHPNGRVVRPIAICGSTHILIARPARVLDGIASRVSVEFPAPSRR